MNLISTLLFLVTSTFAAGIAVVLLDNRFRRTPHQLVPVDSTPDTFTTDEASDLLDALNAHYVLLTHHQGFEDHTYDTGVERPSLTNPTLWSVFYRPTNAGAATLVDVVDVLDVLNAPSADEYARFYAYRDDSPTDQDYQDCKVSFYDSPEAMGPDLANAR